MSDVTIIGAGAWGTALAIQAARAGAGVRLWARDPSRAADIAARRENTRLPGYPLPAPLTITDDLTQAAGLTLVYSHLIALASHLPGRLAA